MKIIINNMITAKPWELSGFPLFYSFLSHHVAFKCLLCCVMLIDNNMLKFTSEPGSRSVCAVFFT